MVQILFTNLMKIIKIERKRMYNCTTSHDLLLGLEKLREMITTG